VTQPNLLDPRRCTYVYVLQLQDGSLAHLDGSNRFPDWHGEDVGVLGSDGLLDTLLVITPPDSA
jgi:hypothetical protein